MIIIFAEERQDKIIELIKEGKSVKVEQLCAEFNVSASTIRRDLQKLEELDLIKRTHGGAVANKKGTKFEPSFVDKENEHLQGKEEIAFKALELVEDGDTIFIDAGTTTAQLAKLLNRRSNLTIVTNGTNTMLELVSTEHQVILTGGIFKKRTLALIGPIAEDNLRQFHIDKAFLGTNGIDLKAGITTPDVVEASVKRVMIEVADEVIVLVDRSKFNETTFVKIVDLADIDKVITDNKLDKEQLIEYQKKVEMIFA